MWSATIKARFLVLCFFILYVNDLNNASELEAILFADDTNLFISHSDHVYLVNKLNGE